MIMCNQALELNWRDFSKEGRLLCFVELGIGIIKLRGKKGRRGRGGNY